jgi:hypothetical protein
MRFYAVRTEAIELTHQALRALDQQRKGSHRPSRALRVATLYGHLQCRARDGVINRLGCRQLANAWHLHPRELRADLHDLAAIGWLSVSSSPLGLCIRLHEPLETTGAAESVTAAVAVLQPQPPAAGEATRSEALPAAVAKPSDADGHQAEADGLIATFAAVYNQARPQAWPAYSPNGRALLGRLQRAIRHAGGAEAFWLLLRRALQAMPEFWRITYPQGRTGAVCAAALLRGDRSSAGLGVEFWHVFSWALVSDGDSNPVEVGQGPSAAMHHPDYRRACRLLAWDGHSWLGQGMEAFELPCSEKQRLAELLETAGIGTPGQAARQFAVGNRS